MANIGFIGARLREAREARSLTGVTLSELAGVTPSMISQYEHGAKSPHPEIVERLATGLNLPVAFFFKNPPQQMMSSLIFRSQSAATKAARTKELRRFNWHLDMVSYLRNYARFPEPNFPNWTFPITSALTDEYIDALATKLRGFWGLGEGPIPDVVEMLERNGAIVVRCELGAATLDAYSGWVDGVPHIILGSDKQAAVRSRFDAAHELGHLILHSDLPPENMRRPDRLKELERQAHFFATAFLIPALSFSDDFAVPTLDGFLALKAKWKVAVAAMIKRAAWLRLISEGQEQRLWIARGRRGWTKREPYDDILMVETPSLLKAAFELGRRSGKLSAGKLRAALPYADGDIEQLAGLPHGYIESMWSESLGANDDATRSMALPDLDTL